MAAFIAGARKQLLIYDPKISDPAMIRLLEERAKAGVEIRILGKITRENPQLPNRKTPNRLHTRRIVRDGRFVFVGSQSVRTMELDMRREVGAIFRDAKLAGRISKTLEGDWQAVEQNQEERTPRRRLPRG
jgi:cardiolipin synthase